MDKLIITVPDWVVCVIGLWFILSVVESVVSIYLHYLRRKVESMELTTSSTASYYSLDTLIMAVGSKYPGESRFETALRYIRQAENKPCGSAKANNNQ